MKNKLLKIKRLMDSPEPGERLAAEEMLKKLMKKHGLTEEDLLDREKKAKYKFNYFNKYEKNLLFQIYCKVLDVNKIRYFRSSKKRIVYFELTATEHLQIDNLYRVYRNKFKKEIEKVLDMASQAFFSKNKLFSSIVEEREEDPNFDHDLFSELYRQMKTINPYFNAKPNNKRRITHGT